MQFSSFSFFKATVISFIFYGNKIYHFTKNSVVPTFVHFLTDMRTCGSVKETRGSDPHHKGERPWRQGSVVVDAIPHTHLHLGLLDSVAGSVVQQTHYSVDRKQIPETLHASG